MKRDASLFSLEGKLLFAVLPFFDGGANVVSLIEARKNYKNFRAIEERFISSVREPLPDEIPK